MASPQSSQPEVVLCGIDLGSNSFHMVIARVSSRGRMTFIDRRKEYVRLAAGLQEDGTLSQEAQERALTCLARFGERIKHLSQRQVRVVGTNTFRKAKAGDFFRNAENALGKTIHVVSGHEEARLVYRGVSFSNQDLGSSISHRYLCCSFGSKPENGSKYSLVIRLHAHSCRSDRA